MRLKNAGSRTIGRAKPRHRAERGRANNVGRRPANGLCRRIARVGRSGDRSEPVEDRHTPSSTARRWPYRAIALIGALRCLLGGTADATDLTLPVGLPWLGAHFRLDALASFFLVVVNLGGAAASLYGLGYGHHDPAPHRVLPFFPAFLAGMNLVVLADDAFSYLLCWEFMSLASWALVMAHHREAGQRQGRLRLSRDGKLRHAGVAAGLRPAGGTGGRLRICRHSRRAAHALCGDAGADPDAARRRLEGRPGAVACLAAARPSGGAQPRLGADERRHDQGRDLRLHPRHVRPAGTADLAGERGRAVPRRHHRRHGHPLRHDGKGSQAPAGLQHDRKYRHHLRQPRPCDGLPGQRPEARRPRSPSRPRCFTCSTTPSSRACCSSAPAPC